MLASFDRAATGGAWLRATDLLAAVAVVALLMAGAVLMPEPSASEPGSLDASPRIVSMNRNQGRTDVAGCDPVANGPARTCVVTRRE